MKGFLLTTLLLLQTAVALAQDLKTEDKALDQGRTKAIMHSFYAEFLKMRPYLLSEEKFKTPAGQKAVGKSLSSLISKISEGPTDKIQSAHGFRINFDLIGEHLQKTQKVFNRGEWDHARLRLNATPNFCVQCHIQLPEKGLKTFGMIDNFKEVSFNNAEFLFVVRQYDRALEQFDELVRKFPKSKVTSDQLPQLYRRKLAVFWRIKQDRDLAVKNLTEDLKNKELPLNITQNLKSWLGEFQKNAFFEADLESKSDKDLLNYLRENAAPTVTRKIAPADTEAALLLKATGAIYHRLAKSGENEMTPEWLLLLSQYEKQLSSAYWYSLSDIYLKECISKFPKLDVTKRCFAAYEDSMASHYPHSVPEEVKANVEAMRQYLPE